MKHNPINMTEREKLVFNLWYFDGLTLEQISMRIGRTRSKVSKIRDSARAKVTQAL